MLTRAGFHSSGKQLMYNGMTGNQIEADIYMGPTYYMRLKHMVKDKINYRARGPNTNLTRQPVQGRANDGGLRIGEMERDGVLAHGMSYFLNESFMIRGDEYHNMAVCNKSGAISVYNKSKNLFFSLFADGPISFHTNPDGSQNVKNISKFGRSFSILRVPYALKLLIQELEVLNIQMRVITDDNVDQLMNMSYSNNITKLLKLEEPTETIEKVKVITREYYAKIFSKWENFKAKTGPALEINEYKLIATNKYEKTPNLALLNRSRDKQPIEKIIENYVKEIKYSLTKQKEIVKIPDESPVMPDTYDSALNLPPAPPNSIESSSVPSNPLESASLSSIPLESTTTPEFDASKYDQVSPPMAPNSPNYDPNLEQGKSDESLKIAIPKIDNSSLQSQNLEKESILNVETSPTEENKEETDENNNNSNDSKKIILTGEIEKEKE
jgi:hypothetical protein